MKAPFALLILSVGALFGCQAAEPFRLNPGSGAGGIFIMPGTGGFGAAGRGGSGGGGSGGEDAGSGSPDAGDPGGTGGTGDDAGMVVDSGVAPRDSGGPRDMSIARDLRPVGPTARFNCYVIPRWAANMPYRGGDRVFHVMDLRVYQCRPWPYEGWCPLPTYEPGDESTGFWREAWVQLGYCE